MSEETEESTGLGGGVESAPESTPESSIDFADEGMYNQFVSSLPEDVRESKVFSETKNLQSLAGQLINAQRALGNKRLEAPNEDWGDDDWREFHNQIMPEEGEYVVPENISIEGFEDAEGLDDDTLQELADLSGQLGLSQKQFEILVEKATGESLETDASYQQAYEEQISKDVQSIKMDWGDSYEQNLASANQAFEVLAEEIPELRTIVENDPTVANNPGVLKLFHKIAEAAGDTLPAAENTDPTSTFGREGSHFVKGELDNLNEKYGELMMQNPSMLSMADRQKRDEVLQKRASLYTKLYS